MDFKNTLFKKENCLIIDVAMLVVRRRALSNSHSSCEVYQREREREKSEADELMNVYRGYNISKNSLLCVIP